MPQLTILDDEYATLWYHSEDKIVHHKIHKFTYGQIFRQILLKGLEVFRQNSARKWLSDSRLSSVLPIADQEWALNEWYPQVFACGWAYWAVVLPDKVAGQLSMNRFMKAYIDQGLTVCVFDDAQEALHWLQTVDKDGEARDAAGEEA